MAIKRDKILKTAEKLVQKGKLEQAIKEYEKLLDASPNDTNTINRLGDLYGRVGEIDQAVERYEQVADRFAEQGFLPKAIAIFKKINRLAPQRLDIFERLGELYVEQGLMVEAKGQFRMLAEHYAKNNDMESAVRAHQRLNDLDPNDSTSRLKFADMLLESGNTEAAMEAYGALGASLLRRDQLDEAERLFRRLLDHELPDGEIMAPVCDRLLDAGRTTSAQELLTAGLEVSPESVSLRTLQVRAFMALGETGPATELARAILKVEPENPTVRGLVGHLLMSEGDDVEATEMMIPAAEALLEKADYSRAQKMLRELVGIAPTDERILRLAIRAFRPSGDQEMITRLTASLADVCFTGGQEDQAKRFYLELVASDPTNQLYRERLAQLDGAVIETENGGEAVILDDDLPSEITFAIDGDEIIDAIGESDPVARDSPAFDPSERINEAAVFAKYGLNDKAVKHLEEVIEHLPDHAEARTALAKMYVAVGDGEAAATTIRPVVERLRKSGRYDEAADLENLYGTPSPDVEEEDDDIIIVEIEDDVEISESTARDAFPLEVDFSDTNVEEMVAAAIGDLDFSRGPGAATPAPATPSNDTRFADEVDLSFEEASLPVIEAEVVEEELVEISAGVDGPSFNELAQLDLFIDQELFDDAVGILGRLEDSYPGDPDLALRRQTLEDRGVTGGSAAAAAVGAPPAVASRARPVEPVRPPAPVAFEPKPSSDDIFDDAPDGDYIDLAKELEEELAEEEAMVEEATGRGKGEALLDEVFREFQKGVAEQLSDEDSDTHFNLGIAYKEMGLLEEAIGEFRISSHDPSFFVEACSMIGVCANELGKHDDAAQWYQKALVAPDLSADARTALRYELAFSFEMTGEIDQAVGLFADIQSIDPAYRDVSARLAALTQQRQVN
jgi:tetratricopeptide (TPR) repeat protein